MILPAELSVSSVAAASKTDRPDLRAIAEEFESVFLTEMLKHTGINSTQSAFGGGAGEAAFSSFLTEAYAQKMAQAGGVGIAEQVFKSLVAKEE